MIPNHHSPARAARIVIVGAGPAGVMLLERTVANHLRDRPEAALHIDLVDPFEPGGGRIWRRQQSPLLKLNSMLQDVTAFTDDSCQLDGPIAPGPSLAEWVAQVRGGDTARPEWHDALLDAEIDSIGPQGFPTRRLNNGYLSWVYGEIRRRAGERITITWHAERAVRVEGPGAAFGEDPESATAVPGAATAAAPAHTVHLASGARLSADAVVHTIGHTGSAPSTESIRLREFASRHDLSYIAPAFTADVDLSTIPAATPVIVRGMGLAATDLVVLLTEGRGGRFIRTESGELRYLASGREPQLILGSGRGVPYRSKITSQTVGDPQQLEYLGAAFHRELRERSTPLDFTTDVWPLISSEMLTGYYRELFTGHPDRVVGDWQEFGAELRTILARPGGAESAELLHLVRNRVPHPDDRFDLASFDRPLAFAESGGPGGSSDSGSGTSVGGNAVHGTSVHGTAIHDRVREHIAQDLRQRTSQRHSATQALFMTVLFSYLSLTEVPAEAWNARSRTDTLPRRWHRFFSYLASGPPGHRLEELLALADAGIVSFLGGELSLETNDTDGVFAATGHALTPNGVAHNRATARELIDAWLPEAQARRSDNPYLRELVTSGIARELAVADAAPTVTGVGVAGSTGSTGSAESTRSTGQLHVHPDGRLVGANAQFAIGPFTSLPTGGAFTRPRLNSLPFRVHDRCARAVLAEVARVWDHADASGFEQVSTAAQDLLTV